MKINRERAKVAKFTSLGEAKNKKSIMPVGVVDNAGVDGAVEGDDLERVVVGGQGAGAIGCLLKSQAVALARAAVPSECRRRQLYINEKGRS